MKIKIFVAREIQYFEIGIFSFNSYVYYLSRAFSLATRAFSLLTHGFELVTRGFELVTRVLLFHLFYLLYIYKNPINLSLLKIELNHGTIIQTQFHD